MESQTDMDMGFLSVLRTDPEAEKGEQRAHVIAFEDESAVYGVSEMDVES